MLAPDGRIQEFITEGITDEERAKIGDPPTGHGILGLLISEARPLRLAEIAAHPKSVGFPPNHPPMRSLLGAPVLARGKVFGNIYVTEKQGADEFSVDDERVAAGAGHPGRCRRRERPAVRGDDPRAR